jgi:signal transduction histidine kinase
MDGEQIKQALLNLVINAMQATPAGGKIVLATSTSNGVATLAVSDSGAGISDAIKERLFTPFATTKEGGTGLGLAIAMKLVKQHGGTIAAANGPNGGAVFEIHLPVIHGLETRQVTVGAASNVAVGGLHG